MESQLKDKLLSELSDAILYGKSDRALELLEKALAEKISFDDIIAESVLKAHLTFNDWYARDKIGSLKAWEFCFFTTVKVLKVLDSRIPIPEKPLFSVIVATVHSEGHITMRDIIATMLRGKGLKVYGIKKGITANDIDGPLADHTLKYVVLSCSEDATKPKLDELTKAIRDRRPDVQIVAGGAMAPKSGADLILNDPLKLYPLLVDHVKN
jgi:methanogenic corrinoid protein MtbC1